MIRRKWNETAIAIWSLLSIFVITTGFTLFTTYTGADTILNKSYQIFQVSTSVSGTIPFPSTLDIIPPDTNLPKEIAAFSGLWEGVWDGKLPSRLAIEKVDLEKAFAVYGWADDPEGRFKGGWFRVAARFIAPRTIEWGGGDKPKFTFTMGKDLRTIRGNREFKGTVSLITMTKKEQIS